MDGVILTTGTGGSSASRFTATILAGDIEPLDIYEASPCPSIKWIVSIHNIATDDVTSLEVHSAHNFNGVVCFNEASILNIGDKIAYDITTVAGPNANEILLAVENSEVTDTIEVCATRIF